MVFIQPIIVRKSVEKLWVFKNECSIGGSTTRQTGNSSIDVCRSGNLDIAYSQTERGQYFPNGHPLSYWLNPLRCSHSSDFLIFKTCKNVGQKSRGPDCIIVSKDDDVSGALLDAMDHLKTFVGEWHCENPYAFWVYGVCELLERTEHLFFSDNDDFLWFSNEPAVSSFFEFFTSINGRHNDRNIFFCNVCGVLRQRYWSVCERC
jgi:hypothetical protein